MLRLVLLDEFNCLLGHIRGRFQIIAERDLRGDGSRILLDLDVLDLKALISFFHYVLHICVNRGLGLFAHIFLLLSHLSIKRIGEVF